MTWFHADDMQCKECFGTSIARRDRLGDSGVVASKFFCLDCDANSRHDNECVSCGKWIVSGGSMCEHCDAAWDILASCHPEGWSDQGEACLSGFEGIIKKQQLSQGHLFNEFVIGIRNHWRNPDGTAMEMPSACNWLTRDVRATESLSYAIECVEAAIKELGYPMEDLEPDASHHIEAGYMLSLLKDAAGRLEAIKDHAKRNYFWLDEAEDQDDSVDLD